MALNADKLHAGQVGMYLDLKAQAARIVAQLNAMAADAQVLTAQLTDPAEKAEVAQIRTDLIAAARIPLGL